MKNILEWSMETVRHTPNEIKYGAGFEWDKIWTFNGGEEGLLIQGDPRQPPTTQNLRGATCSVQPTLDICDHCNSCGEGRRTRFCTNLATFNYGG